MTAATDSDGKAPGGAKSAGDQLKRARESRNLTIQQVAQALHLDPWILEALEQNRFKDVGAPVFVKGHLRKYASEIGLDSQQLMEAYYAADDTPETPGLVTDTFTRPQSDQHGRWPVIVVSALLALLVILVAFLWLRGGAMPSFFQDDEADSAADAVPTSSMPAVTTSANDRGVPREVAPTGSVETDEQASAGIAAEVNQSVADKADKAVGSSASDEATEQTRSPAADPGQDAGQIAGQDAGQVAGQVRVDISLQNDSWVEIYDANNRRLFFDLARAGSTTNVTGKPPLQVLLGNSDDARVRVNDAVWPIPAAARRGKTARFTIR